MKIKWGALVTDGRGKLGGHVASKNRGGNYLRTKTTPVNPQSTAQTDVRSIFGNLSQAWSGLTESERESFNEAVGDFAQTDIFGDLKNPSGKALFQRLNQNLLLVNQSQLNSAPGLVGSPEEIASAVAIDTVGSTITPNGLATSAGVFVVMRASGKVSAGTSFVKNRMRIVSTFEANSAPADGGYADYVAKFGAPQTGDKIFFEFNYVLSNGVQTPKVKLLATIS